VATDNSSHAQLARTGSTGSELAHHDGPHEKPEDWGWHHEFRAGRQIAGWMCFLVLGALLTTTHYNRTGNVALILGMVIIAGGLIFDRQRRKKQWRS
jgi:hypothetical protein